MQQVEEIGSGASRRLKRGGLTEAAGRRAADAVVVSERAKDGIAQARAEGKFTLS